VVENILFRFDLHFCNQHAGTAPGCSNRSVMMTKTIRLALALTALVGLAACHTTAGVGQDLSQGGHALTNSANANAPQNPNP